MKKSTFSLKYLHNLHQQQQQQQQHRYHQFANVFSSMNNDSNNHRWRDKVTKIVRKCFHKIDDNRPKMTKCLLIFILRQVSARWVKSAGGLPHQFNAVRSMSARIKRRCSLIQLNSFSVALYGSYIRRLRHRNSFRERDLNGKFDSMREGGERQRERTEN